ncbi:hypothetical protein ACFYO1_20975 [Nocardia sp. NPDC006044]|uniref:hypothetical protein n=1 Tax=Nocardia sp. NPDC006044 TaxID=3364306 RepID=UPI0036C0D753
MKPTVTLQRTLLGAAAVGMIGAATVAPAVAAPAEVSPAPPTVTPVLVQTPPSPLLHALPAPLACLVTTGFALWCIGIT